MKLTDELYKDLQWSGKWVFDFPLAENSVEARIKGKKLTQEQKYRKATNALQSLKKKRMIQDIGNGLYVLVPFKYVGEKKKFIADKFHVAQGIINKLGKENYSYVSHHSAMELHGASTSVFNYIYITSEKPFPSFDYGPFTFKRVAPSTAWKSNEMYDNTKGKKIQSIDESTVKWIGYDAYDREGMSIRTSIQEITFVDCIEKLKYAGGLEEFSRNFSALNDLQSHAVVHYTLAHDKVSLNAKVGFFMDLLKRITDTADEYDDHIEIEEHDLTVLRQNIKTDKVFYLDKDAKDQVLVKEWNLIVPRDLFELYSDLGGEEPEAH